MLLGALVLWALRYEAWRWLVLPAVLAACASDYVDGMLARQSGAESEIGRLVDNLSDATFLALAFCGFAEASTWSGARRSATGYWDHANWLPLIGLALSFGTYLLHWAVARLRGATGRGSLRGHHAGVLNYSLAVVGGVAVLPGVTITPWFLEPLSIAIALFNVTAAMDTVALLWGERGRCG